MTGLLGASQGVCATGKGIHPAPVTDFSGTPLSGSSPLSVQFTDLTTNSPQFWAWDFGDGETSAAQNPAHTYAADGTYTVSLNAANESGFDIETKADYIEATAGAVAWDSASKSATAVLSNNDLTFTTTDQVTGDQVKSTTAHSSGKYALKFVCTFGAPASSEECGVGVAPATYDPATNTPFITDVGLYVGNDGLYIPSFLDLGLEIASGEYLTCAVNFDTGKVWFGNASGYVGDPEAGTGETATFTPNTSLVAIGSAYSDGGDPVSATFDPAYSSGTFAAW